MPAKTSKPCYQFWPEAMHPVAIFGLWLPTLLHILAAPVAIFGRSNKEDKTGYINPSEVRNDKRPRLHISQLLSCEGSVHFVLLFSHRPTHQLPTILYDRVTSLSRSGSGNLMRM